MAIEHRMVHFRDGDIAEVVDEFDRIAAAGDAAEWITISPWVDPQDLPVRSMLHRIFSARASKVPEATWVAAHGDEAAQLGVLHATGSGALGRVNDAGFDVPDTWRKLGDHSKRGCSLRSIPTRRLARSSKLPSGFHGCWRWCRLTTGGLPKCQQRTNARLLASPAG